MPKTKISEYSVTNSSNTDIEGINIDEGCAPSGINNAIRELMVHLKEFQTGASGDGFTFAGGTLMTGTNTLSGTNVLSGSTTAAFAAGTVSAPSIAAHGDTNTGIFFPAADTIAFAEGGAEAMRIDSSGNVGIGATATQFGTAYKTVEIAGTDGAFIRLRGSSDTVASQDAAIYKVVGSTGALWLRNYANGPIGFMTNNTERARIDESGNVGIGTSSPVANNSGAKTLQVDGGANGVDIRLTNTGTGATASNGSAVVLAGADFYLWNYESAFTAFGTNNTERARIDSSGRFFVGTTTTTPAASNVSGAVIGDNSAGTPVAGVAQFSANGTPLYVNRTSDDGGLVRFFQGGTEEGSISVSGNTVSYNAFAGGHWTQLPEGRGYNPDILRGTVMSTIGEMCEWKSVVWDEVIEHPAVPAVEAKEAVLDEEGNVAEPAVEAVKGKDAWTETFNKREAYLGQLPVGATFEEDGVTKTVVDDGNERLPKVKISDVVGDKAVYGVFQTWDEVQDMLVTSLGAFVVRIAAGVTVQIGDLLESNGDGCAKVQDDDVIRSKTIGKVTSITPSATYADGSYTVPAVLYCG